MNDRPQPLRIARLDSREPDFRASLERLTAWESAHDEGVEQRVREIIADVRRRGDAALLEYTNRLDGRAVGSLAELEVRPEQCRAALAATDAATRSALELAARRIRRYHERQRLSSWRADDGEGTVLGQEVRALDRVGLYVPGGRAAYPSSVLMNALPAKVAGVGEIVMVVPAPGGVLNELVLAAAALAEVDRIFTVGGAQAVAALAYGTAAIPQVDKIVGPGNVWVATAKRMVFGVVGIDMIAGPSEVVVVCDGATDAEWIALDLFAQAEHDEQARAMVISPDADFLERVETAIGRLLPVMDRAAIIRAALASRGALVRVRDLGEAVDVANRVAPEHLELSVADPEALLPRIRHAGAIFMGRYTAEALGDYCAGPNHVLPTARTARFSSPLGVYDFQKRASVIHCTASAAARLGVSAAVLARAEGLDAHARSAEARRRKGEDD